MAQSLLLTKLYIPTQRPGLVPRPGLIERLNQGCQGGNKLSLISAPAGYGKSTLLGEWASQAGLPLAWLSLDEQDNEFKRFLAYFVAAIQSVWPDFGEVVTSLIRAAHSPPAETVLTALINELADLQQSLALVLDDYHLIDSEPVHQALSFLLDHMPAQLHLIISSRADPPLPLAKLRARGQIVELREADLRFSPTEAADFLNRMMGLELSLEESTTLHGRTEGWPAGLQLAAISMQGWEHPADFIQAFSGSHEYVVDYLTDEVLARQAASYRTFLLQTSILDRLCGPLCAAITGQADSSQILEYLKGANLFLISLDDERHWYRYHRLFSDLLRQRLLQSMPDAVPDLHRRASQWLEKNGFILLSIQHALEAGDYERAADLVEAAVSRPDTLSVLEAPALMAWLERLPVELLQERPRLRLYKARILTINGQPQAAGIVLQELKEELGQYLAASPERDQLLEQIDIDLVSNAILLGEVRRATSHSEELLAQLPGDNRPVRMRLLAILGLAYSQTGETNRAGEAYSGAIEVAQAIGIPVVTATLKTGLAQVLIVKGRLREAAQIIEEAVQTSEIDRQRTAAAGPALVAWAGILYEQNELTRAEELTREGIDLLRQSGPAHGLAAAYTAQALIQQALGQSGESLKSISQATQLTQGQPGGYLSARLPAYQARLWLAQGELKLAEHWAKDYGQLGPSEYSREFEDLTLARAWLASGRPDEALTLLERLQETAGPAGREGSLVEIMALKALTFSAVGEGDQARQALGQSLNLARPEGYVRTYINEGEPMARLLVEVREAGIEADYAGELLAAMPLGEAPERGVRPPVGMVEPLSQRELEVLQLIGEGLTNREIGQRLVISLPTVKSHTGNIYSKLGVSNRTKAVAKARKLRIL